MTPRRDELDAALARLPLPDDADAERLVDPARTHEMIAEITSMPRSPEMPAALPTTAHAAGARHEDPVRPAGRGGTMGPDDTTTAPRPRARDRHRDPSPRGRGRRRLVAGLTVTALGVAAAAGAAGLFTSNASSLGCRLPDDGLLVVDPVSGDPVADCTAELAALGLDVPPLVAYDNGSGGVEVRPAGADVPEGYVPLAPGVGQDPRVVELEAALTDVADGLHASCSTLDAARSLAEAELDRLGLSGWSVRADGDPADGTSTCTTAFTDPATDEVVLVALGGLVVPPEAPFMAFAADLAAALRDDCLSAGDAAAAAEQLAAARGLDGVVVRTVDDPSADCTRVDVNVGGRVEVTLRGPAG